VSYDDADTLAVKKRFANNRCLGGTMIWAVDLDEPGSPTLRALAAADGNTPDWIRNLPAGAGVFFGKRRLEAIAEQEDSGLIRPSPTLAISSTYLPMYASH
jgi:GH18 family chitinase